MSKKKDKNPELKLIVKNDEDKHVEILEAKLQEIQDLFDAHQQVLVEITRKREQLNKEEETVQFELSGLHGAITVINQLIEEAKDSFKD
jgi:hypothetical protein